MCGQSAVRRSLERNQRLHDHAGPQLHSSAYACSTGIAKLSDVANGESLLPRDFMDETGTHISKKFHDYLAPLVQGEVRVPMGADGLPVYPRLKRKLVAKKCGDWKK